MWSKVKETLHSLILLQLLETINSGCDGNGGWGDECLHTGSFLLIWYNFLKWVYVPLQSYCLVFLKDLWIVSTEEQKKDFIEPDPRPRPAHPPHPAKKNTRKSRACSVMYVCTLCICWGWSIKRKLNSVKDERERKGDNKMERKSTQQHYL